MKNVNRSGGTFSDELMKLGGSDHMIYKKANVARQLKRHRERALAKRRQLKPQTRGFG